MTNIHYQMHIRIALMAIVLGMSLSAIAQSSDPAAPPEPDRLRESYGGIVLNQTITVGGQDFYRQFVSLWRDKPLTDTYAISVHERPSARFGTQVWIEYAQRRMFQSTLPSSRAAIGALSERAVETAYQSVVDTSVQRLLFQHDDLGRDEI